MQLFHVELNFTEIVMFTSKEVDVLVECIATQRAVFNRRYNAEKNPGIRELIAQQMVELDALTVAVRNPKLLEKK